jgi:hypothetical protein
MNVWQTYKERERVVWRTLGEAYVQQWTAIGQCMYVNLLFSLTLIYKLVCEYTKPTFTILEVSICL